MELLKTGGYLLQSHRSARAQFLGADAYLRSQSELCPVGEARRGIHVDACGIDHLLEPAGVGLVLRDDALAVPGVVRGNVVKSLVQGVHHLDRQLVVHELHAIIAINDFHSLFPHRFEQDIELVKA